MFFGKLYYIGEKHSHIVLKKNFNALNVHRVFLKVIAMHIFKEIIFIHTYILYFISKVSIFII